MGQPCEFYLQVEHAFRSALEYLSGRLGPEVGGWAWGKVHTLPFRHVLGAIGAERAVGSGSNYDAYAVSGEWTAGASTDLAALLDHGLPPTRGVGGDMGTVGNTGMGAGYSATSGGNTWR